MSNLELALKIERCLEDFPLEEYPALHRDFLQQVAAALRAAHQQPEPVVERDGSARWAIEVKREACAQLCADYTEWCRSWGQDSNYTAAEAAANECAVAIRAREQKAEPVAHKRATDGANGQSMTQADNGNPSF